MALKLEGHGSIGTHLLQMVLECSPTTPPLDPGFSITIEDPTETEVEHKNWILLTPEQAKQLSDYLRTLYP